MNFRRCGVSGNASFCGVNVRVIPSGPIQTNAYLLTHGGEAVLVDAPDGIWEQVAPVLEREDAKLSALWLTHGHWDHTQGAAEVVRRTGVPVYAHEGDRPLIETPEVMRPLLIPGITVEPVRVDRWLKDGDSLEALGDRVGVSHVPGHSAGSLMFHFPASRAAFAGDALFRGSVGRTDLPGGDFYVLERSIRTRIYVLPDDTRVFPGHGGPTSVGAEKASNPHVRA